MAEENLNQSGADVTEHQDADVSTLDALHLDGKGTDRLDDAEEQDMPEGGAGEKEDVKGFANVQSANRETFEKMQQGAPAEEGAVPVGDQVIPEIYSPSEPDNVVEARFENPAPRFVPEQADAAEAAGDGPGREGLRIEDVEQAPRPEATAPAAEDEEDGAAAQPVAAIDVPTGAEPGELPAPAQVDIPDDPNPPVAQAPVLSVSVANGVEDVPTKLSITAFTADSDGGAETLSALSISGVPSYFIIVDGAGNPVGRLSGGTWTLDNPSPAQLDNLYLKNLDDDDDADFSGTLTLTVTATASDTGTTATSSAPLVVNITAVADAPGLTVADSAGMENTWIDLSIAVVDKDVGADNSESQTLYISGLPAGASLRYTDADGAVHTVAASTQAGEPGLPAGTYYLVPAEHQGRVEVLPPANSSADFTLTVHARSVEQSNGDSAVTGPRTIQVDVGVVDPLLSGSGRGDEDGWADLTLSARVDAADGGETIAVYVEDLPAGVILRGSDGTVLVPTTYTDADGNSHTGYDVTAWRQADGSVTGLQVGWDTTQAATTHVDDNIAFNLRAVVRDGNSDDDSGQYRDSGDSVRARAPDVSDAVIPVAVVVRAVADAPTLAAQAIGVEDKWFSLDIDAGLVDRDGSETLTVTVTGDPNQFSLRDGATGTVYAPVANGDGTVTYTLTPAALDRLEIKGARDSDADFNLVVKATATEAAAGTELAVKTATTTQVVTVQVLSDADAPQVSVVQDPIPVTEDQFVGLRDLIAGTPAVRGWLGEWGGADGAAQSPDTTETLSFELVAKDESRLWIDADGDGVQDAGEVRVLHAGDTVSLTAAQVFGGLVKVGGAVDWASAGPGDLVQFDIKVIAREANDATDDGLEGQLQSGLTRSGTAESAPQTLSLYIQPAFDAASVSAANAGKEDQQVELGEGRIALTPTVVFTDTDGSERPDMGGTTTITTSDPEMVGGDIYVNGVKLEPSSVTYAADGVTVTAKTWDVPNTTLAQSPAGGNTWVMGGVTFQSERHVAGEATYSISVAVFDTQGTVTGAVTGTGTLSVAAIADTPAVAAADVSLTETAAVQAVNLSITPTLVDADGSETLYVYVTGVPDGVTLNHGSLVAAGTVVDGVTFAGTTYRLTQAELSGLQANLPAGYSDDFQLTVYSATVETSVGQSVVAGQGVAISAAATLKVEIGVLDPEISATLAAGTEDGGLYSLAGISIAVPAADATDTLTVRIEGLSAGFTLTTADGTPLAASGGVYTIPAGLIVGGTLSGVYLKGTGNSDADATFTVRAIKTDRDVNTATEDALGTAYQDSGEDVQTLTVTVKADADAPTLSTVAVGVEDKWVNLNVSAALTDTDGSESLTVEISGLPAGVVLSAPNATVSATTQGGVTTYSIGPAETTEQMKSWLSDLRLTGLPANSDSDFTISVKAYATEDASGDQVAGKTAYAATPVSVKVTVYGDADKPEVTVTRGATEATAVTVQEDQFYNLQTVLQGRSGEDAAATLTGLSADGSETVSYVISAGDPNEVVRVKVWNAAKTSFTVTELSGTATKTVSIQDVLAGRVEVGGAANWGDDTLHVKITPLAVEADGDTGTERTAANKALSDSNALDSIAANDLTRQHQQSGDTKDFYLRVDPTRDATYISSGVSGDEDQVGGIPFAPVLQLTDTDGSEKLVGTVDILIKQGSMDGHLEAGGAQLVASGTMVVNGVTYDVYSLPVSPYAQAGAAAGSYVLSGVTYVPKAHSDLDVTYRVHVTTQDGSGADALVYDTSTDEATLVVQAVADAPVLAIGAGSVVGGVVTVTGDENDGSPAYHGIALNLSAALPDSDGSEVLANAELRNVPDGWTVSYYAADGTYLGDAVKGAADAQGDYTWTLNPAHVAVGSTVSVVLVPPVHADADAAQVVFWAQSKEDALNDGDADDQVKTATAASSTTFNVLVNAVADQPNLMVSNARVDEDGVVKLDIRGALVDTDGSETLTYQITGVPAGGGFVDAAGNPVGTVSGGVWSFTSAQVGGLYFKPGADNNADASLTVTAVATETADNGTAADNVATRSATIQVVVAGKSDGALDQNGAAVTATSGNLAATGAEDQLINLRLGDYTVADRDVALGRAASETLSMVLWGIPAGVSLVLVDAAGATVETSDYLKYIGTAADGTAQWSVAPEYLSMVRLSAPANYAGSFDVKLRVVTTEDDGDSLAVDKTLTVTVTPVADQPGGHVTGSHAEDDWRAGGVDHGVDFGFSVAAGDQGGGNAAIGSGVAEVVTDVNVTIDVSELVAKGVPTTSLSVTHDGHIYQPALVGGKWVIVVADVAVTPGAQVDVSGFKLFGVPANWSDDVPVTLSVTVTDTLAGTVSTRTEDVAGAIRIDAVADQPVFAINLGTSDLNAADGTATLNGTIAVADSDGSETLYLVVSGVPNGVTVAGGVNSGGGTWIVPSADGSIENLTFTSSLPAGSHTLTIKALVTDTDPDSHATSQASAQTTVTIDFGTPSGGGGTGSTLIPKATASGSLSGNEDGSISLSTLSFAITDDDAATSHTYTHTGASVYDESGTLVGTLSVNLKLPAGWSISGNAYYDADTGSYTIPYGSLASVRVTPPKDYAGSGYDLDVRGVVTTTSGLYDTSSGNTYVDVPVSVAAVTDGAAIAAAAGAASEDNAVAISLSLSAQDVDFSEVLTNGTITITVADVSGHQPGTLSGAGVVANGGGSYTLQLTPAQIAEFANPADGVVTVNGLTFTPAANFSGKVDIGFATTVAEDDPATPGTVENADPRSSGTTLSFTVGAVIDDTSIAAADVAGAEDTAIALDVSIAHQDIAGTSTWGSENVSVVIGNVPAGAVIEGAYNNGDGTWTVKASALSISASGIVLTGVKYLPGQDDSSDHQLSVTTYVFEKGNATPQVTTADFWVRVGAVTDGATVNPGDVTTTEDSVIALDLGAQLLDTIGGSEQVTLTVSGVPAGATFASSASDFAGHPVGTAVTQADGTVTWSFSPAEVQALGLTSGGLLYFKTAQHASGSWTMTVQASTRDVDSASDAAPAAGAVVVSNALSFTVTQTGVADAPLLTLTPVASATEDNVQLLDISASLVDADSETLSVVLSGAPAGTVFHYQEGGAWTAVHADTNGVWTIPGGTADALSGIRMTTPANYNGGFTLTVTAQASEDGTTAQDAAAQAGTPLTIQVTVAAENDAPVLDVTTGAGAGSGVHTSPLYVVPDNPDPAVTNEIVLSDVDSTVFTKMTLTIGGAGMAGTDTLALSGLDDVELGGDGTLYVTVDGAVVAVSYDHASHTLTFAGNASAGQYQALAQHVVLSSTTGSLAGGQRVVTITATDDHGASGSDTATVTITDSNGPAVLSGAALGDVSFTADGVAVLPAGSVAGVEDATIALTLDMAGAVGPTQTVTITGAPEGAEFILAGGGSVVAGAAGVTLQGSQLAGLSVNLGDWSGTATLVVAASDGAGLVMTEQVGLTVSAGIGGTDPTGVLSGSQAEPIHVVDSFTVADASTQLSGLTIAMTGAGMNDSLALSGLDLTLDGSGGLTVHGTGISVDYDAASHTLSFSGAGSAAIYQEIANSVVLSNDTGTLEAGTRQFEIRLYDAQGDADSLTTDVALSGTVTLGDDALGDIRWGADGTDLGDDIKVVHSGSTEASVNGQLANYINGGAGFDSLTLEAGGHHGWLFQVDDQDPTKVTATAADDSGFIVRIDADVTASVSQDGDLVFNGDATGAITFDDNTTIHFAHIERLVG